MRDIKALTLGLFLTLASVTGAFAQCGTQAPANKFCGNDTGSQALATYKSIPAGALTPIAGGTVLGNPTGALAVPVATTAPVLGIPGTSTGQVGLAGSGSGTAILRAQATAGSAVSLLPTAGGTLVGTVTAPLTLDAATGLLSLPGQSGGVLAGSSPAFTRTPVLGVPGSFQGTLGFAGLTSGTATITAQATAGSPTLILPNTSGTFAVGASSPLVLSATTGALTCPTCVTSSGGGAITGTAPISVSAAGVVSINAPYVSLTANNGGIVYSGATNLAIFNGTATARLPLLSGASTTPQWGAYTLPASVTSGGIGYFSSTGAESSSGLLTANALLLGGGAGGAPTNVGSLGTTTTVLHGNAGGAPTFGAVVSADLNITATSCSNQFVSAISAGGVGTCTTPTLASAQFANQGTTTTVLHGNAAGNPSFSAVAISTDVSGLGTGVAGWLGTPSSANLRTALTDETGTGLAYFQGGDIGTPSAGNATNIIGLNASQLNAGNVPVARAAIVSAFSVNKNSVDQTGIVSATFTSVTWPTELYDVNSHFASNGWTPDAGKVTMTAAFFATGTITAGSSAAISIFKNGANYKQTSWGAATGAASALISTDDIANGTDVYTVQAFITTTAGTATITGNPGNTFFTGHWISP